MDSAKEAAAQADANAIYTEYVAAVAEKGGDIEEGTLYIQVNGGYVKYENGKAVKTNDSYITTLPDNLTQVQVDLDEDGNIEDGEKFAIYK